MAFETWAWVHWWQWVEVGSSQRECWQQPPQPRLVVVPKTIAERTRKVPGRVLVVVVVAVVVAVVVWLQVAVVALGKHQWWVGVVPWVVREPVVDAVEEVVLVVAVAVVVVALALVVVLVVAVVVVAEVVQTLWLHSLVVVLDDFHSWQQLLRQQALLDSPIHRVVSSHVPDDHSYDLVPFPNEVPFPTRLPFVVLVPMQHLP